MTEIPEGTMKRLEELSVKLNEATDEMMGMFDALEHRLGVLKLGVSTWIDGIVHPGTGDVYQFGYDKLGDRWGLGVRRVGADGNYATQPIANVSRALRVGAAVRIELLLDKLLEEATAAYENVRSAVNETVDHEERDESQA